MPASRLTEYEPKYFVLPPLDRGAMAVAGPILGWSNGIFNRERSAASLPTWAGSSSAAGAEDSGGYHFKDLVGDGRSSRRLLPLLAELIENYCSKAIGPTFRRCSAAIGSSCRLCFNIISGIAVSRDTKRPGTVRCREDLTAAVYLA